MKRIAQRPEPQSLNDFRENRPQSSWEELRNDAEVGGMAAHRAIKRTSLAQQRCLCAFCEQRIHEQVPDLFFDENIPNIRIEHFHPKSDQTTETNWNLVWGNLWAVCHGGDSWPPMAIPNPKQRVEPKSENLSCDAFKNKQIEIGKLPLQPEGWMLSPDLIPAFPTLFRYSTEGEILADETACAGFAINGNQFATTNALVNATIARLNLNCPRLSRLRESVIYELEDMFLDLSEGEPDRGAELFAKYAENTFKDDPQQPWPEYFSLYRWYLGVAAETRLQQIGYAG